MAYTYTSIDGKRVEVNVAAAFARMRAAFEAAWGLSLIVADGTRTRAEQTAYYQDYLNRGRTPPIVAAPGYSNHEESGPRGPRALDIWDTGSDYGVTRAGTPRANWLRHNAPAFGFNPAGYSFSEPWHYEYVGAIGGTGQSGPDQGTMVAQERLNYTINAGLAVDGYWGPKTRAAVVAFQGAYGLVADGEFGPITRAKLDAVYAEKKAAEAAAAALAAAEAEAAARAAEEAERARLEAEAAAAAEAERKAAEEAAQAEKPTPDPVVVPEPPKPTLAEQLEAADTLIAALVVLWRALFGRRS